MIARAPLVNGPLFVDAHVHFHRVFELQPFLSAAAENVAAAAAVVAPALSAKSAVGVLLLTEGRGEDAFVRIRSAAASLTGGWSIEPTAEASSLLVRRAGQLRLIVVAGRQIVTREGIEVLALLSAEPFADASTLDETLTQVRNARAVAVLPWGFGKWTLRRGALVASLIRSRQPGLFVGDNAGRLGIARVPPLLTEARRRGVPVLPGSDPLPFRDRETRAGSYGFVADVELDEARPAEGLWLWFYDLRSQPPTFGRLEKLPAFCRDQLRMQWRKRVARKLRSGP